MRERKRERKEGRKENGKESRRNGKVGNGEEGEEREKDSQRFRICVCAHTYAVAHTKTELHNT